MEIKVSAVVPVYNSVNTLERAVKSLLIQPEINEIFIVDDGSSDGSYELAKKLESKHSLIKVLTHENRINKGASAARNLGLKFCTNEWIQFLDADDELLTSKINSQLKLINDDLALVLGNSLDRNSKRIKKVSVDKDLLNGLLTGYCGNTCSNLWNKSAIIKAGFWNESLINTQESDLMLRIYKINKNYLISKEYLTVVYVMPNSITTSEEYKEIKILNQYYLKLAVLDLVRSRYFFYFKYRLNFDGYIGTMLKNQKFSSELKYSRIYFFLFKVKKSLLDRLEIWFQL